MHIWREFSFSSFSCVFFLFNFFSACLIDSWATHFHVFGSKKFNAHVLKRRKKSSPSERERCERFYSKDNQHALWATSIMRAPGTKPDEEKQKKTKIGLFLDDSNAQIGIHCVLGCYVFLICMDAFVPQHSLLKSTNMLYAGWKEMAANLL